MKAYPSVADLPQPADLAVIIIPAQHVAEELERCGKAGVRSAVVLSSRVRRGRRRRGRRECRTEMRAVAKRYDMAVMGPNSEGFANIAANLCPTFSPAMEAGGRPLVPAGRAAPPGRGGRPERRHGLRLLRPRARQGAVVPLRRHDRQRGVPGGARLRRVHPRRGQDRRADAAAGGRQDGGDVPARGREGAEGRQAHHRQQDRPVATPACGRRHRIPRRWPAPTPPTRRCSSATASIEGRDIGEMVDIAAGFLAWGERLPRGTPGRHLHGARAAAAAGWRTPARRPAWRFPSSMSRRAGASTSTCRPTARRRTRSMPRRRPCPRSATPAWPSWCCPRPMIDGIIVVMSGAPAAQHWSASARPWRGSRETSEKPILMWSYTLPAQRSVRDPERGRAAALSPTSATARAPCARWPTTAPLRERFLRPIEVTSAISCRTRPRRAPALAAAGPALCEWEARPILGGLRHRRQRASARWQPRREEAVAAAKAIGGAVALKVQSPDILHKTEAGAVALNLRRPEDVRAAYERVLANARRHAPDGAHPGRAGAADGAAGPRGHSRHQARRHLRPAADGGPRRRCSGGAEGRGAGARAARCRRGTRAARPG